MNSITAAELAAIAAAVLAENPEFSLEDCVKTAVKLVELSAAAIVNHRKEVGL